MVRRRVAVRQLAFRTMNQLFVVAFVLLASISTAVASEYEVRELGRDSANLLVTLKLPRQSQRVRELVSRAQFLGLKSQILSPRCGKNLLRQRPVGVWAVPIGCTEVMWTVRAQRAVDGKVDVSAQSSVKFRNPPWFIFSEATSLLRLRDEDEPSTITMRGKSKHFSGIGATEISDNVWRVPSLGNAPEFYALGEVRPTTRNVGPFVVRYVADDRARVAGLGLGNLHEQALEFLANVVPPAAALPPAERSLLVVWIGIDEAAGRAGGAAGSRSFVANYVVGKSENEALNAARTLAILAHEQFHQLSDLARGSLPPLPTWLNESLAHYYGLKALQKAASSSASHSVYKRFIDPARPVTTGLLEFNRRYAANDRSVYSLFYEQGATFWSEVDSTIQAATNGGSSLDQLVPNLLRSVTPDNDGLPESFLASLHELIGVKADELLSRYVGN